MTEQKVQSTLDPRRQMERMVRVDQAGEYGAVRIYAGQQAVLGTRHSGMLVDKMARQEQVHLDRFNDLMNARHVRPTLLSPLWHVAGFALGAATALMSEKAAMACTVAVEEVIDEHYQKQVEKLGDTDSELTELIEDCRQEEVAHRQTALDEGAEAAFGYPVLHAGIKTATRTAIWLSKRI